MATDLLTDVIQVGSSHAESVISESNLKWYQHMAPKETIKVTWHAHVDKISLDKNQHHSSKK
jgi:hypothetical protein